MDPKRFYKSADQTKFPKYFQFGTVVEGPTEFYSGMIPYEVTLSVPCAGAAVAGGDENGFLANVNCCINLQDAYSRLGKQCKHP